MMERRGGQIVSVDLTFSHRNLSTMWQYCIHASKKSALLITLFIVESYTV